VTPLVAKSRELREELRGAVVRAEDQNFAVHSFVHAFTAAATAAKVALKFSIRRRKALRTGTDFMIF
jgi:hypothetical protein